MKTVHLVFANNGPLLKQYNLIRRLMANQNKTSAKIALPQARRQMLTLVKVLCGNGGCVTRRVSNRVYVIYKQFLCDIGSNTFIYDYKSVTQTIKALQIISNLNAAGAASNKTKTTNKGKTK